MRRGHYAGIFLLLFVLVPTCRGADDDLKELAARAAKGEAAAQFELGRRYSAGDGVAKDHAAALQWYLKAAAQGHAKAQVGLGSAYAHGFGVKQDWAESIRWYRLSAGQGDTTAQHNLGLDYAHGHGVEADPAQAARWFRLAADQGHARAQYNLGELVEQGRSVAKSDLDAYVLYHLAAAHDRLEHLFGQPKMLELLQKRDRVAQRLTAEQIADGRKRIRAAEALEAVHPRRFGAPGTGVRPSRGWYIWRKFDADTWEAEVGREDTNEIWKVRVLPWLTTYRYLTYGARPDELLSGERVNLFFSPDENHRRGYLVHFQDELCQMKGHGHYWQVQSVNGRDFTARVMAGDKPLDDRVLPFTIDPKCRSWQGGMPVDRIALQAGSKAYLTWVLRGDQRLVMLMADDASLEKIKEEESARVATQVAAEGIAGRVESMDGDTVHLMIFSTYWQQAGKLSAGMTGHLRMTGKGFHPLGGPVPVRILSQKNRGAYGSGVNDVQLRLDRPEDAKRMEDWPVGMVTRLILAKPEKRPGQYGLPQKFCDTTPEVESLK